MTTVHKPASAGNPFEPLDRLHALHERGRTGGPLWCLDDFMYMGTSGVNLQAYKHRMSRRYLYVDQWGNTWSDDRGDERARPRSYTHAITWALDGWTPRRMDEALSVQHGLRAELAKAVRR